jgi:hypothetical protein
MLNVYFWMTMFAYMVLAATIFLIVFAGGG